MRLKFFLFAGILLLIGLKSEAQQESQTSYSGLINGLVNLATPQDKEYIQLNSAVRFQWNQLEGQPINQRLSVIVPTYVFDLNYGLMIQNESIGAQNRTKIIGGVSKQFYWNDDILLGLGFNLGTIIATLDASRLLTKVSEDPVISQQKETYTGFLFDITTYLRYKNLSISSVINSLNSPVLEKDEILFGKENVFLSFVLGYDHKVNNNFDVESFLSLITVNPLVQTLIETNVWYKEKALVGLGYRGILGDTNDAILFRGGLKYKMLKLLYTYEPGVSTLNSFHQNTHDIGFEYLLKNKLNYQKNRVIIENPRF